MIDTWLNIKNISISNNKSIQFIEFPDSYNIVLNHGGVNRDATLEKGTSDCNDFENNFKSNGNKAFKDTLITEPANLSVTLFRATDVISVISEQSTIIDLLLIPAAGERTQIFYGGALYASNPTFEDYVKFQVVDKDNIIGYGPGVVLKEYIKKAYLNNNNTFEDYDDAGASIPVGLYLRCIYVSANNINENKVKINYLLGVT